ncbi:MAG: hypothetical protein K9J85_07370, partial [Desulfobacteraceae bacterium]|nr:hypothetical protein [Desulfobacteraceae bacterium]
MGKDGFKKTFDLKRNEVAEVRFLPCDAAILYPSLGCPALVRIDESGDAWLEMIIISKDPDVRRSEVAFHLRYIEWNRKDKSNSTGYRQLKIGPDYLWKIQDKYSPQDMIRISDPVSADNYKNIFFNSFFDEDDGFSVKLTHTNIFPWMLWQYKEQKYQHLYKIAVNLKFEEAGGMKGKLFNFIWLEKQLYVEAKNRPNMMEICSDLRKDTVNSGYKARLSEFGKADKKNDFFAANYHPVYVTDKKYLDIGHITDVHLDSRMEVYAKSVASVIEVKENKMEIKDGKERVINNNDKEVCKKLKDVVANFNELFKNISSR